MESIVNELENMDQFTQENMVSSFHKILSGQFTTTKTLQPNVVVTKGRQSQAAKRETGQAASSSKRYPSAFERVEAKLIHEKRQCLKMDKQKQRQKLNQKSEHTGAFISTQRTRRQTQESKIEYEKNVRHTDQSSSVGKNDSDTSYVRHAPDNNSDPMHL